MTNCPNVLSLPASEQYSFIHHGNAQVLDHALTSSAAAPFVSGFAFGRGNADAAEEYIDDETTALRSSDHDGFALFLGKVTLFTDGFESGDTTAWHAPSL